MNSANIAGNRSPLVSVIVPAYNNARYIGETLDSIFAQTLRDYEVIVVNGGSPDTPQLEEALGRYQNQIRYFKQADRGVSGDRNTGIRNAQGEFLAFPDSDDIWLPNFLVDQVKFFDENPSLDMSCADCIYFGDTNVIHRSWHHLMGQSWLSRNPAESPVTLEKLLPTHGGAFPSFVLLRKATALRVGFFDEELRLLEDYHYWLRLVHCGGKFAYLRKVLGKRRVHPESLTYDRNVVLPHALMALKKFLATLEPSGREASVVRREIAFAQSRLGLREGRRRLAMRDYEGAKKSFAEAQSAVSSGKLRLALLGLRWAPQSTCWAISRWDNSSIRRLFLLTRNTKCERAIHHQRSGERE
jgi:GT2 family glycosyltransferase